MDEAFSALDVLTAENLRNEVVELWSNSQRAGIRSIFFVTHNIDEAAFMASSHRDHFHAPRAHQACDSQSAALPARRQFAGLRRAGRADPRGDHVTGIAG